MPNFHDPFIQFLVNNSISLVIGLVAIAVAVWAVIQARSKKEISYEIVSKAPVVSVNEKMVNRVKILLDGKEIEEPYLTIIKFTNSGNKAIAENDFVDPIAIDFKGSQIVSAEIIETNPEKYFATPQDKTDFIQWTGSEATLKKKFLNPGNQFVISTLIEKKTQEIDINGVIVEGKIKKKTEPFNFNLIVIISILLFSYLYSLISNYTHTGVRFDLFTVISLITIAPLIVFVKLHLKAWFEAFTRWIK